MNKEEILRTIRLHDCSSGFWRIIEYAVEQLNEEQIKNIEKDIEEDGD